MTAHPVAGTMEVRERRIRRIVYLKGRLEKLLWLPWTAGVFRKALAARRELACLRDKIKRGGK